MYGHITQLLIHSSIQQIFIVSGPILDAADTTISKTKVFLGFACQWGVEVEEAMNNQAPVCQVVYVGVNEIQQPKGRERNLTRGQKEPH